MNGGGSERDSIPAARTAARTLFDRAADAGASERRGETLRIYEGRHIVGVSHPAAEWSFGRVMPVDVIDRIERPPEGGFEFFASPRAKYTGYFFVAAADGEVAATGMAIARGELPARTARAGAPVLVANRVGKSWMHDTKGGCAVISGSGEILANTAPHAREDILIFDLPVKKSDNGSDGQNSG